jgi:hypothetical protein
MRARAVEVCRYGLLGWVIVFFGGVAVFGFIAVAASVSGIHSVSLSLGPVGLMSSWSNSNGYGFQTDWGVGAAAYLGALVGVALGLRNDRRRAGAQAPVAGRA